MSEIRLMNAAVFFVWVVVAGAAPAYGQSATSETPFFRVFGIAQDVPAEIMARVPSLPPGERIELDTDGDGEVDEAWYVDGSKRHTKKPLLVRLVDEDGDNAASRRGDYDSDSYFWDHHADGSIDTVVDYQDDDGDGDVDQMGIFFFDNDGVLTVWWAVDVGDDNRLWFDVDGDYNQRLCQWRSHFGGDELFYQFRLDSGATEWLNVWEDPFAFYDIDKDACSEAVVRISAKGYDVHNVRYSIDADDDAWGDRSHDYDIGITALPPEGGLSCEPWCDTTLIIRGIATRPVVSWNNAIQLAQTASFGKVMLTWDEINSNTDANAENDPHERWEGIINHASKDKDFPQVGGPPCSPFNKRVEVASSPEAPVRLYFNRGDHRFHLLGAHYGYLDVDYNFDGAIDAAYSWIDDNGDGIFDRREVDVDADGTLDISHSLVASEAAIPMQFDSIAPAYKESLELARRESIAFIGAARGLLEQTPVSANDVVAFYENELADYLPEVEAGAYIQRSPAGTRFYVDLIRDRMFVALKRELTSRTEWTPIESHYLRGEYAQAADRLLELLDAATDSAARHPMRSDGNQYTRRIPVIISIDDPELPLYEKTPIVLDAASIRESAEDFNERNCVVVIDHYGISWLRIPHQIDEWGPDGQMQLSFLADISAARENTYYIYFDPEGVSGTDYPVLTGAVLDNPAYVAWESDSGAFRFYTGQFDFFGKHESRLLARPERLIYPLLNVNYHEEQDWGIDALHVGSTSGLGGLTLYGDGSEFPVQSPAGVGDVAFEHTVLGAGPVRAAVEIRATNVIPDDPANAVVVRCLIYAGHRESEVQVRLPGSWRDLSIAPGLMRLAEGKSFVNRDLGVLGEWGRQDGAIGEIGLALIVPPEGIASVHELPTERRVECDATDLRYWILGSWRRGMQYPIAPTAADWRIEIEQLAARLGASPRIIIGEAEDLGTAN